MLIIVIDNWECPVCESQQPHVYQDKQEQLVCLRCWKEGRDTVIKLVNPGVVIGRHIKN